MRWRRSDLSAVTLCQPVSHAAVVRAGLGKCRDAGQVRVISNAGGLAERSPCGSLAAAVVVQRALQCRNGAATGTDRATDTLGRKATDRRQMRESVGRPLQGPAGPARRTWDPFYRVNARGVIGCSGVRQGVLPRFWSWDAGAAPAPLDGWVVSTVVGRLC